MLCKINILWSPVHLQNPELPMHLQILVCVYQRQHLCLKHYHYSYPLGMENQRKYRNVSETKLQFLRELLKAGKSVVPTHYP